MVQKQTIKRLKQYCLLQENNYYNDEPLFYAFNAIVKKTPIKSIHGTAISFDMDLAKLRALGEAVERFAMIPNKTSKNNILYSTYDLLPSNKVDLSDFSILNNNPTLLNRFKHLSMGWMKVRRADGKASDDSSESYIPAQLVFVPYKYFDKEPVIQEPISTGAAFHINKNEALISGIMEVLERDSFITSFYTHTGNYKLILDKVLDPNLRYMLRELKRNFLEPFFFDISRTPYLHVILCLMFDKTNNQPLIVSGLGSSFNLKSALIKSIEEALQLRPWLREEFFKGNIHKVKKQSIKDYLERVAYWNYNSSVSRIKERLSFYFELPEKNVEMDDLKLNSLLNANEKLEKLMSICKKQGLEIFYVDITPDFLKKSFVVLKVIIPKCQPFFLNEEYSFISKTRIKGKEKVFTQNPHFFL